MRDRNTPGISGWVLCLEGDCSKLSQVIGLMTAILHVNVTKTIMICDNLLPHYSWCGSMDSSW